MRLQVGQELLEVRGHLRGDGRAVLLHERGDHLLLLARPGAQDRVDARDLLRHADRDVEAFHLLAPVDRLHRSGRWPLIVATTSSTAAIGLRADRSIRSRGVGGGRSWGTTGRGPRETTTAVPSGGSVHTSSGHGALVATAAHGGGRGHQLEEGVRGGAGRRRSNALLVRVAQQCAALVAGGARVALVGGEAHVGAARGDAKVVVILVVQRVGRVALVVDLCDTK